MLDAVKNLFHPVAAFAAGTALAAGLMGVKARDIPCRPHHADSLVHDDDAAGAEQTARRRHRFVIEIYFFDLIGLQHRHRGAAGDHAL